MIKKNMIKKNMIKKNMIKKNVIKKNVVLKVQLVKTKIILKVRRVKTRETFGSSRHIHVLPYPTLLGKGSQTLAFKPSMPSMKTAAYDPLPTFALLPLPLLPFLPVLSQAPAEVTLPYIPPGGESQEGSGGGYCVEKKNRRVLDRLLYNSWKQGVLRAFSYKCFITGSISTASNRLECHHLMGWWNESTRYYIPNGVVLSKSIHKQFHRLYGRGKNLTIQFEEFCTNQYSITDFPWRLSTVSNYKPRFTVEQERVILINFTKQKSDEFKILVQKRNHTIVSGTYESNFSHLALHCREHNQTQWIMAGVYKKRAKRVLACCVAERKNQSLNKFKALAQMRNHIIISGNYKNYLSQFTLHCPRHNHTQCIVVDTYKHATFGLKCCVFEKQSQNAIKMNALKKSKLTPGQKMLAKAAKKQEKSANLKNKKLEEFKALVDKRNHSIISGNYDNCLSKFTLHCSRHDYTECTSVKYYKKNSAGLKCCASENTREGVIKSNIRRGKKPKLTLDQEMAAKLTKKQEKIADLRKQKTEEFFALVQQRNHTVISGNYMDCYSTFVLFCASHNHTQSVVVRIYKNNKTGLKCCAAALFDNMKHKKNNNTS